MKKILNLIVFTILMVFPFAVKAANFTVTASSTSLEPNQNVSVTIGISGVDAIGSINFKVTYPTAKLTYKGYSNPAVDPTFNSEAGSISFALSKTSGMSGNLVTLNFTTTAAATSGDSTVSVSLIDGDCYDVTGVTAIPVSNGSVQISHKVKSSDNSIKTLTINDRTVSPPYDTSINANEAVIGVVTNHNKANVTGHGKKSLSCGRNEFTITVTAENGESKNYSVVITRNCSGNVLLKSLSLDKAKIDFGKNTESYNIKVTGEVDGITVSASAEDSKSKVTGDGYHKLKYGDNTIVIKVTAEDGASKEYTLYINREDNRSDDNKLNSLTITDFYKPGEDALLSEKSDKLEKENNFKINVDYSVEAVNVKAVANDTKAKVSGNVGKINLKVGSNKVTVTVTAENEKKNVYTITIIRKSENGEEGNLDKDNSLSIINIAGYSLNFDSDTLEYNLVIDEVIDHLDLEALANSENASVVIIGNEDLKPGNNVITVEVTAENGDVKTYTINVKLPGGEESNVGIESQNTTTTTGSSNEKKGNTLLIVCGVLVLLGIGGLVFFLLSKKKKNKNDDIKPVDNNKVEPATSLLSTNEVRSEGTISSSAVESNNVSISDNLNNNSVLEQAAALESSMKVEEPKKEEPKLDTPSIDIKPVAMSASVEPSVPSVDNNINSIPSSSTSIPEPSIESNISSTPSGLSPVVEPSVDTSNFANVAEAAVSQSIPEVRTIPDINNISEPHEMPEEKLVSEVKSVHDVDSFSDDTLTDTQMVQTIQNVSVEKIDIDDL